MGFRPGAYASLWTVEPKSDRMTSGRISITRKNKNTGEYETSFSGFVGFAGTACASQAAKLKPTDTHPVRIKLGDVDVSNTYDKEKRVTYWNPLVFSFELADEAGSQNSMDDMLAVAEAGVDGDTDGMPW